MTILISPAQAQFHAAAAGYLARIHSPGGSMPPVLLGSTLDAPQRGPGYQFSVGLVRRPRASFAGNSVGPGTQEQVFAMGADFPLGARGIFHATRLGVSGGAIVAPCGDATRCIGYMGGVQFRGTVLEELVDPSNSHGPVVRMGLAADAGYGDHGSRTVAAGFGVPISLALRVGNRTSLSENDPRLQPRTVFFVQPSIVNGRVLGNGGHESNTYGELVVGASVLDFGAGFGTTASYRKQLNEAASGQVSLMLSWRRPRASADNSAR
jgi:hypothetical protein